MEQIKDKNTQNIVLIVLLILSIALNMLTNRNSIVVDIFILFYGLLIVKLFKGDSFKDKLYFSTVLFGVVSFNFLIKVKGRYDIYFYYISVLMYLICMLKDYKQYNLKLIMKNNYFRFLMVFIIYMTTSILWSANRYLALKSAISYMIMISFLIVVVDYNARTGNILKTMRYLYYMLPGIILVGLVEITGNRFDLRNHYVDENLYRLSPEFLKKIPTTFFYSPNNYGVFIVLAMVFLFVAIIYSSSKKIKYVSGILYLLLQPFLLFAYTKNRLFQFSPPL